MKNVVIFIALFLSPMVSSAAGDLGSADSLVQTQFPGSKILVRTSCEVGHKKMDSIGYLLQTESATESKHPLLPLVLYRSKQKWVASEIPTSLGSSKGSIHDFLAEFWDAKTSALKGKYEIRCANPNKDKDISTAANGEFAKYFGNRKSGKHICFQADATYNSWSCFNFNYVTRKIESSFSQMNAD